MTWDCGGAVQTGTTDENGKTSTVTFYDATKTPTFDPLWRPIYSTDAAGNQTTYAYSTTTAENKLLFNNSNSVVDSLVTLDSMARTHVSQRRQSPTSTNYDSVETDYDALGRSYKTTMPYAATAGQTATSPKLVTTTYDGASRVAQVTDAGGGTLGYDYITNSGINDVLMTAGPAPTGEHTKQRQLEYDGAGRLSSVCELTSVSGSGSCGQSHSQIGYWTKYTYDVLGDLLTVAQNAQSGTSQNRTYAYDGLGRLTSENNPETGTTTYVYDTDASHACSGTYNGDLVKRVDAVGDVTCYTYDALHRVTSTTYPAGAYLASTASKYFVYDSATVNGQTLVNTKGRLGEAYTVGNLTFNPDFVTTGNWGLPSGWSISGGQQYATGTTQGASANLDSSGNQWKSIQPGQTLTLSAYVYRAAGTGLLSWGAAFVDASHNVTGYFGCQVGNGGSTGTGTWNFYQSSVVAPANTAYFEVYTELHGCAESDHTQTSGYFSHVWASIAGQKTTDLGFSYSVRGEISDTYESTAHSGGYYHLTGAYWPHGPLKSLSGLPGLPTLYYGASDGTGLDGEGRYSKVNASSGQNPITGMTYTTSGTTQPIGSLTQATLGSADYDTFSYDVNTGRLAQYQFNVGSPLKTDTGALTWNTNGSLKQLAITDQWNSADTQTCTYGYDDLSRVTSANCGTPWNQSFSFDPFGNVAKSGSVSFNPGYSASTETQSKIGGKIIGVLKLVLGKKVWRDWSIVLPEIPRKEQRYFTEDEMHQIIDGSKGQWRVLFATLALTGLRAGEAFGLHVEDLDLEAGTITVRRSVWNGEEVTPKTNSGYRVVHIDPVQSDLLRVHLNGRRGGRVFQTRTGTPLSKGNVRRKLHETLRALGIPLGGLHAFRHGRVSVLQSRGVPGDLVKEWVGHSNLHTTSRYTHFDDGYKRRVARSLSLGVEEKLPDGPHSPRFRDSEGFSESH